ncbi:MAG TPA: PaaI family thioesterase [Synergistaceae bacterium]|jgi:uncharacterized protein (TIGR00369 family)|nr:PaaI family thioesterase [Synergistaceae bacterium]
MERLPRSRGCFVCGRKEENPRSLELEILWDRDERRTVINIEPDGTWCGYEGVVHGGIIASVFDDAMAWAVRQEIGNWAVTGEMSVRYLRPVTADRRYRVEGRTERISGRRIATTASMTDDHGRKVAEGRALFIRMPSKKGRTGETPSAGDEDATT